jgi:hypothetical protein
LVGQRLLVESCTARSLGSDQLSEMDREKNLP